MVDLVVMTVMIDNAVRVALPRVFTRGGASGGPIARFGR